MNKELKCNICNKPIESSKQFIMVGKCVSCEADYVIRNKPTEENNLVYTELNEKKTNLK